uniref:M56 family metallopeptidase n=1 Tax=Alistipes shahii TaxID=328814 RepID=UPI003FF0DFDD
MYDLMIYSLKVGVCLAVFYLFFKLLLSRETFHRFNRIVVLGAMFLSFVLPLCVITVYREIPVLPEIPDGEAVATAFAEPLSEPFPWEMLAGAAFLLGAAATLLWTLCSLIGVLRLIRGGRRERLEDGAVLVRTERPVTPFSWGRYIVMSERDLAENGGAILLHERAHLRLRHSLDLIVTDVAGCLQWFNPAMWLLRRELRAIHEYEADEAVLDSGVDARSYQMLLIKKAAGGRWYSIANSFNHSKLKKRITMMLKEKSSPWARLKYLYVLPVAAIAV